MRNTTILHEETVNPLDLPEPEYSPGWHEQEGDRIRGTLISRDWRTPEEKDRKPYEIFTLDLAEGCSARIKDGETTETVAVHASRMVLAKKLAKLNPEYGAELTISYVGPPQGTGVAHNYRAAELRDDRWVEVRTRFPKSGAPVDYLAELRNGQFVPIAEPSVHAPLDDEAEAVTQAALEAERDERDAAASELSVHQPLHEKASNVNVLQS